MGAGRAASLLAIGPYTFELPDWWNEVQVEVPEDLRTEGDIGRYVAEHYGADTGTAQTWAAALKVWALAASRIGGFPVFVGHAYAAGGHSREAARVFADLHALARTQGAQADWFDCFLAYNAAEMLRRSGEPAAARPWYEQASRFAGSEDGAIDYYGRQAAEALRVLDCPATEPDATLGCPLGTWRLALVWAALPGCPNAPAASEELVFRASRPPGDGVPPLVVDLLGGPSEYSLVVDDVTACGTTCEVTVRATNESACAAGAGFALRLRVDETGEVEGTGEYAEWEPAAEPRCFRIRSADEPAACTRGIGVSGTLEAP